MKVLFVCSGNRTIGKPGPVVRNQSDALISEGVNIRFYLITKAGFLGYLLSIIPLINAIKKEKPNCIHSHYSLSAFVSTVALFFVRSKIKHVVSLMGSDAQSKGWKKYLIRLFHKKYWSYTIVKSESMAIQLNLNDYNVIPNGVDLNKIKPIDEIDSKNLNTVIFVADPSRFSKNFPLAQKSIDIAKLSNQKINFLTKFNMLHKDVVELLNSSSCLLLTSRWEGSPNIVKEAMACNIPIVSTNVGDVEWLLDGVEGCFVVNHNENEIGNAILNALNFFNLNRKTMGRKKIIDLQLDSSSISSKIISLYENIKNR